MVCIFYNSIDMFGNVVNADGINLQGVSDGFAHHLLPQPHQLYEDSAAMARDTVFGKLNLQQFWEVANRSQMPLDNNTTQFISHQLPTHICDCNVSCSLVFCVHSGGIFAVCAKQECFCIFTVLQRSALLQLDVGQIMPFGHSCLDRYTTWTHAMRWFGWTFTERFIRQLHKNPADAPWERGSYLIELRENASRNNEGDKTYNNDVPREGNQLKNDEELQDEASNSKNNMKSKTRADDYDYFVSYRGATGAGWIWLSLCGHLHAAPVLVFVFGVCPLIVLILYFAVNLACRPVPDGIVELVESAQQPEVGSVFGFVACHQHFQVYYYVVFGIWGCVVCCLIVLFWNPIFSWIHIPYLAPRKKIFLDKFC